MVPALFSLDRMVASYGVSSEDLRRYEGQGLLRPIPVGGAPHYTAQDRVRLEIVLKGLRLGFSIDEITVMILGTLVVSATRCAQAPFDRDRVIDELRSLLTHQGCPDVSIDDLKSLLRRQ